MDLGENDRDFVDLTGSGAGSASADRDAPAAARGESNAARAAEAARVRARRSSMDHGASAAAAVDRERDRDAPADEADEIESLPLLDDDGLRALLARSTRDVPLSRAEIRHAERSLKSLLGQRGLSRAATGTIRERLAAATRHRQDYDHQYTGRRRQPRVARGGVPAAATYRDDES